MVDNPEVQDFIAHVGVKGMRWGVRKAKTTADIKNSKEVQRRKTASERRRILKDEDLDKYISRLEKEKKFKALTDADTKPGKTFAQQVMTNAGRTALTAVVTGIGVYTVRAMLEGKFDPKEAAKHLKPKK
jgi:hypothetical protein